jgi:hypothetical protein
LKKKIAFLKKKANVFLSKIPFINKTTTKIVLKNVFLETKLAAILMFPY